MDNERLGVENKRQAIEILELLAANEVLEARIAKLEAQIGQNSANSSKPPSLDTLTERQAQNLKRAERRAAAREEAKAAKRPGKQPGAPGHHLARVERPDRVVRHAPSSCGCCGADLASAPVEAIVSRQVFDLPDIKSLVTEHVVERKRCRCGATTTGDFPPEAKGATCWGPNVAALALYLMVRQHLPVARVAEMLSDVCGAPVSTGWLAGLAPAASEKLDPFMATLADGLAASKVLHMDETGARISGVRHWFHVASNATLTYLCCHQKRGKEAIEAIGILSRAAGVAVHDCWGSYLGYGCTHQLCCAHLLRELAAAAEEPKEAAWANDMIGLLLDAKRQVAKADANGSESLTRYRLRTISAKYQAIADRGLVAAADPGQSATWWPKDRKAYNLAKRLADRRHQVLGFTRDFAIPFDNNQGERDLRMVKLQQKISGCFRTLAGAEAFARLRSYIQTALKQGQNLFQVIRDLVLGNPWMPAINLSG
ncbi:MAG: IS66 family transposase [bacterium]